jgi:hypothetical protein
MSPFDDKRDERQQSVERFRRFSTLLGDGEATAPLRDLALEMERHLLQGPVRTEHDELKRLREVLLAEIDVIIAWSKSRMLRSPGFSAAGLREESRVCLEEAKAARDTATRRAFARRALDLAMLAEHATRRTTEAPAPGRL